MGESQNPKPKEAKETIYWLRTVRAKRSPGTELQALIEEATELMKIFGAILELV